MAESKLGSGRRGGWGGGAGKGIFASTDIRVESSFPWGTEALPSARRDAAPGRTPFINSAKLTLAPH